MQKLRKNFKFVKVTLDEILITSDDSNYGYWVIHNFEFSDECKDKTRNFSLLPLKRKADNNELGYKERGSL